MSIFDGKPASFVNVSRTGNQRALEIEEAVQDFVESMILPEGVAVSTWANEAKLVRDRTGMLMRNGLIGLSLVFGCLLLFLNLRLAFWTSMGIPISFMGGFIIMYAVGLSINMVSLFAFILVLGVVVDDAIVVGENIYARMEDGMKPQLAAIVGLREILPPVTIGILTTMAAFTPLLLVSGLMGQNDVFNTRSGYQRTTFLPGGGHADIAVPLVAAKPGWQGRSAGAGAGPLSGGAGPCCRKFLPPGIALYAEEALRDRCNRSRIADGGNGDCRRRAPEVYLY